MGSLGSALTNLTVFNLHVPRNNIPNSHWFIGRFLIVLSGNSPFVLHRMTHMERTYKSHVDNLYIYIHCLLYMALKTKSISTHHTRQNTRPPHRFLGRATCGTVSFGNLCVLCESLGDRAVDFWEGGKQ